MVLTLPQGHEDSEYILSFEIGQRESGFYSEQTDRITEPSSTLLVYRYQYSASYVEYMMRVTRERFCLQFFVKLH